MDEDQVQAYNLIIGGHNLCLTGQAGTGKSYVVKKAVRVEETGDACFFDLFNGYWNEFFMTKKLAQCINGLGL